MPNEKLEKAINTALKTETLLDQQNKETLDTIKAFISSHTHGDTIDISEIFDKNVRLSPVITYYKDPHDDTLHAEPLRKLSIATIPITMSFTRETIRLNDNRAELFDRANYCLIPEILEILDDIELDLGTKAATIESQNKVVYHV